MLREREDRIIHPINHGAIYPNVRLGNRDSPYAAVDTYVQIAIPEYLPDGPPFQTPPNARPPLLLVKPWNLIKPAHRTVQSLKSITIRSLKPPEHEHSRVAKLITCKFPRLKILLPVDAVFEIPILPIDGESRRRADLPRTRRRCLRRSHVALQCRRICLMKHCALLHGL